MNSDKSEQDCQDASCGNDPREKLTNVNRDKMEKKQDTYQNDNCSDISCSSGEAETDGSSEDVGSEASSIPNCSESHVSPACIMYQKDLSTSSVASSNHRSTSRSISRENSWMLNHSSAQVQQLQRTQVSSYDRYIGDWLRLHPKSKTYSSTTNSRYLARSNAVSMKNYPRAFNSHAFQFANTNQYQGGTVERPEFNTAGYAGHVDPHEYSMYYSHPSQMDNFHLHDPQLRSKSDGSPLNSIEEGEANKYGLNQYNLRAHENKMAEKTSVNITPNNIHDMSTQDDQLNHEIHNSGYTNHVAVPMHNSPPVVVNILNNMSINSVNTIETEASTATNPPTVFLAGPTKPKEAAHNGMGDPSKNWSHGQPAKNDFRNFDPPNSLHPQDTVVESHVVYTTIRETSAESGNSTGNINSGNGFESSQTERASAQNLQAEDDLHRASSNSKYETYNCRIDRHQGDASVEIPLFSFERPHMRAFHFSWMSFFVGFFAWYAITPLLSEVQASLDLSKQAIWTSSLCAVAGTVVFRIMAGPLCDYFGARWVAGVTLFLTAIPTMATGLVQGAVELCILRLLQGISGSLFVTGMYWTSSMFTREVAGTANAVVAGWGNLGGGATQLITGSLLFPLFKWFYGETNLGESEGVQADYVSKADRAWRTVFIIPAMMCFIFSFIVIRFSDDCPKGNYRKLKKLGLKRAVSLKDSFKTGCQDFNTWLLFIQYACCFGVELTTANAAPLFFKEEFHQSTESAAAIASVFGWMNLFARGMGGFFGDISNVKFGMRGRLLFQSIILILQGVSIITFSYINTLSGSIVNMAIFSLFVQTAEGSTFGIVPYVNPAFTGSIVGLVGAGGNFGGVLFGLMFRQWDYRRAFHVMGWTCICSAFLSIFVSIKGQSSFFGRPNNPKKHNTSSCTEQPNNLSNSQPGTEIHKAQEGIDTVVPK